MSEDKQDTIDAPLDKPLTVELPIDDDQRPQLPETPNDNAENAQQKDESLTDGAHTQTAEDGKVAEADSNDAANKDAEAAREFKKLIVENVREEDSPFTRNLTLRKILGGDILNTAFIRQQVWVVLLLALFAIIYISNRYACQQNIIEIDKLQKELQDAKYKALSSKSQLTEKSRESNVLEQLKNNQDSTLKIASQPPYIINVPESEQDQ